MMKGSVIDPGKEDKNTKGSVIDYGKDDLMMKGSVIDHGMKNLKARQHDDPIANKVLHNLDALGMGFGTSTNKDFCSSVIDHGKDDLMTKGSVIDHGMKNLKTRQYDNPIANRLLHNLDALGIGSGNYDGTLRRGRPAPRSTQA